MLSQVRRWGWLFNPITLFFVWDQDEEDDAPSDHPVGVILEVTNTPWKERSRYPLVLEASDWSLTASFDKAMHVSPFLGLDYRYHLLVEDRDEKVVFSIDVAQPDGDVILHTGVYLDRTPASRQVLGQSLRSTALPTHRVSAGIHAQAARLWAKKVPFVSHPGKKSA